MMKHKKKLRLSVHMQLAEIIGIFQSNLSLMYVETQSYWFCPNCGFAICCPPALADPLKITKPLAMY